MRCAGRAPGRAQGYHAITFGMYARALFERLIADESLGAFLRLTQGLLALNRGGHVHDCSEHAGDRAFGVVAHAPFTAHVADAIHTT